MREIYKDRRGCGGQESREDEERVKLKKGEDSTWNEMERDERTKWGRTWKYEDQRIDNSEGEK